MSLESPNFLERRPKWQVVGAIVLLVLASYGFVFWLGTIKAREWADSDYLVEREERMKREAVLEQENEKLRLENEAKAEVLRTADTAAEAKRLQEFQKRQDERAKKSEEIKNATPEETASRLCADAKASEVKFSFCE